MMEFDDDDKVACLVLGCSAERNRELFNALTAMPADRRILIGDQPPFVAAYLDAGGRMDLFPAGTPLPEHEHLVVLNAAK